MKNDCQVIVLNIDVKIFTRFGKKFTISSTFIAKPYHTNGKKIEENNIISSTHVRFVTHSRPNVSLFLLLNKRKN